MLVPVPTDHPFAGIAVKLRRADENIANLGDEIFRFFQECKYPVMPDPDDQRTQDAINYHRGLLIPKRFAVLAGEIVHHFRSCLDHIVWIFSDPAYRTAHESTLQFPVIIDPPDANTLKRFERQIGGIPNPSKVRQLISDFQPYQTGADALNHPLAIVHNMDRFDKHRELVIVQPIGNLILPKDASDEIVAIATAYGKGQTLSKADRTTLFNAIKNQGKMLPQVAFAKFGKSENQFVVPSLRQLADHIETVVVSFMAAL